MDADGDTELHSAIIFQEPERALYLIAAKPELIDRKNDLQQTPLYLAARTNQFAVLKRLVEAGADVSARSSKTGNTVLHDLCLSGNSELLKELTELLDDKDDNVWNAKNYAGSTCLHSAVEEGLLDVVGVLLKVASVDKNAARGTDGKTAVSLASWNGDANMVKLLLNAGCDCNSKCWNGSTAFDVARSREHWSVMLELATRGAARNDDEEDESL